MSMPTPQAKVPQLAHAPASHKNYEDRNADVNEQRQKAALYIQRTEYITKAKRLENELEKLKDTHFDLHEDHWRSPSPETKSYLEKNTKLQREIKKELKNIRNMVSMLDNIINEAPDSCKSNDADDNSPRTKKEKSEKRRSQDRNRSNARERDRETEPPKKSKSKKDDSKKRRSTDRDRSPLRDKDKEWFIKTQEKIRSKKEDSEKLKSMDCDHSLVQDEDKELLLKIQKTLRMNKSEDHDRSREKHLVEELHMKSKSKKDEDKKRVSQERDCSAKLESDLLMELQNKLRHKERRGTQKHKERDRIQLESRSKQSRTDINKERSPDVEMTLLRGILTSKGERSRREVRSDSKDKWGKSSSDDDDEFRLEGNDVHDINVYGKSRSQSKDYSWSDSSENDEKCMSGRKRHLTENHPNAREKRFRHGNPSEFSRNISGEIQSNVVLDNILSLLSNAKDTVSFKLPLTDNILPDFDPMSNELSVKKWIIKVEKCAVRYGWIEKEIIQNALSKLTGIAKTWYESLSSVLYSWRQWKKKLTETFQPCDDYAELLLEMLAKRVKIGESLEVYYYEKLKLLNRCKIFKKYAVDCILNGVEDETTKEGAKRADFGEPEQLLQYFKGLKKLSIDDIKDDMFTKQTLDYCDNCNEYGHHIKQCDNPNIKSFECGKVGHVTHDCPGRKSTATKNNKNFTPTSYLTEHNATQLYMSNGKSDSACHNCKKNGHQSLNCNKPRNNCNRCGKTGHLLEYCKFSPKTDNCRNCGEIHLKLKCKKPRNKCTVCGKLGHLPDYCKQSDTIKTVMEVRNTIDEENVTKSLGKKDKSNTVCHNCTQIGHRSFNCKQPRVNCTRCDKKGHLLEFCKLPDPIGSDVCRNCNEIGHLSINCNKPVNKCTSCGKFGHLRDYCNTDVNKVTNEKSITCFNCNKIGHPGTKCRKPSTQCYVCNKFGHHGDNCFKHKRNTDVQKTIKIKEKSQNENVSVSVVNEYNNKSEPLIKSPCTKPDSKNKTEKLLPKFNVTDKSNNANENSASKLYVSDNLEDKKHYQVTKIFTTENQPEHKSANLCVENDLCDKVEIKIEIE